MKNNLISNSQTWKTLAVQSEIPVFLHDLFAKEPDRSLKMTFTAVGWTVDFSRQLVDESRMKLLLQLARETDVTGAIKRMFAGEAINTTEKRSVLHTALRALPGESVMSKGYDVIPEVHHELKKMRAYVDGILSGDLKGYTGKKIRRVIAIGIGGSNLGPEMASRALSEYSTGLDVRYVSNVDPTDLTSALSGADAGETLFIVSSKTFTTTETTQNAQAARQWCVSRLGSDKAVANHFAAVSTNSELVQEFGILPYNMFIFWDWVGGRYSMTSAIGLPTMLSIGTKNFDDMLEGFREMDVHYREEPLEGNVPVLMALFNLWNSSFLKMQTHAVVAYDEYLGLLPDHLQQLVMESLGKRVTLEGTPVDYPTCPVFFGGVGTNVQHSYFQLLHQGAGVTVPVDFIGFIESLHPIEHMHKDLLLNMIAQANVMAFGESGEALARRGGNPFLIPHQVIPGNKPSSIMICEKLTPKTLGQLVSLYENMVHAWSVLLGIDAFDQFGVEVGKRVARQLGSQLTGKLDAQSALKMLRTVPSGSGKQ